MRIGILSDTHDQVRRTAIAVSRLIEEGAEVLIHCGDLTGPAVVEECVGVPAYFVFGNNDYEEARLARAIALTGGICLGNGDLIELGGKRIAVTHGHLDSEITRLEALRPDYFLFGHSHVATDQRQGSTRLINPGALHRASRLSVALLDLSTDQLRSLTIIPSR